MKHANATLRVGLLGMSHEANSFALTRVDEAYIAAAGIWRGAALHREYRGSESTAGGFIAAAEADGHVDLIPLVLTTLVPAGPLTAGALASQARGIREALHSAGPFDGLLVVLHGAAVSENIDDVDGYLLEQIREAVGGGVVVGTSLDLHANISHLMCSTTDLLNTYRTNPHIDARPRAEEIARLVFATARGEIAPTTALVQIPAFINILQQNTSESPMAEIMADLTATAGVGGVLTASVAEGYPYADVSEMGMSAVVITDGDATLAEHLAARLAHAVWARRSSFEADAPDADEAIEVARSASSTPVLLLDVGDNIGGGAPGNSIVLLDAAIRADFRDLVTIVLDPPSASVCHRAGLGASVALTIGASYGQAATAPLQTQGVVIGLSSGSFEVGETLHAGFRKFEAGPSAAVLLASGQTVVLTSRATLPLTPLQLQDVGLSLENFKAVVAKGVHSPLAGYGPHVATVLQVDTPGVTSADCFQFPYRKRRRPLFPFERDTNFPSAAGGPGA